MYTKLQTNKRKLVLMCFQIEHLRQATKGKKEDSLFLT